MAEFCVDCWNVMAGTTLPASKYILSEEWELCEGCAQYKHVVITEKRYYFRRKHRKLWKVLDVLWRIIMLPYVLYKYRNEK